jgi:predicted DsbA family dithiol-disulfide isomerase
MNPTLGANRGTDHDLANSDPYVVTVWSDIGCPWASLALHTLELTAKDRAIDLVIDHRAFPLELFNRSPTPKELLEAELIAIAGHLPHLGWQLWNASTSSYPVTMLPALEAVQAAKDPRVGGLRASQQLDTALRHAFYVESRCISIHPVILDIAATCHHVDHAALADALARGDGRSQVYRQWHTAQGARVEGSPHLFASDDRYAAHNPGATYHWTARPPLGFPLEPHGFPVLEDYDREWASQLLDVISGVVPPR